MSPNAKCGDRGDGRAGIESDEEFEENFDEEYNDDELLVGAGFVRQGGLGLSLEKNLASGKMNFSQRTANDMVSSEKASSKQPKHQGRDDRATSEQVMDPRTRLMLFKMLNSGFLSDIDGCLSTGKEANVYYAKAGERGLSLEAGFKEYAVKVFKTSILVFKDRDRYISGEYRFRNGYCRSNPRKMVKTWAEKELRNLRRLHAAGIPSPKPVLLKNHILVMEFLGEDGWPSPRLKDANLSDKKLAECYFQVVKVMRRMYQSCKLVHGDLSEYNMLWHKGSVMVIDVSQSVEHDHPSSNDFLRSDCANVNAFFGKGIRGALQPMSTRQLFDFVVDDSIQEAQEDGVLASLALEENSGEDLSDDGVFMKTFIPTSLSQVSNCEADQKKLESGDREAAYSARVLQMLNKEADQEAEQPARPKPTPVLLKAPPSNPPNPPAGGAEGGAEEGGSRGSEDSGSDSISDSISDGSGDEGRRWEWDGDARGRLPPAGSEERSQAKALKKDEARRAKEEKREKRKTKIPKHIKKGKIKASSGSKSNKKH